MFNNTIKTMTKNTPEQDLLFCFKLRDRLYRKGGNDERLNDKIRKLQRDTGYKIIDVLGKEKINEK